MIRHTRQVRGWPASIGAGIVSVLAALLAGGAGCGQRSIDALGPRGSQGDPGGRIPGIGGSPAGSRFSGSGGAVAGGACDGAVVSERVSSPAGLAPNFSGLTTTMGLQPPPISGGTLTALHDRGSAVVADPDRDRIYVVDLGLVGTPRLRWTIVLGEGDRPGRSVEDGAGMVHVILRGTNQVVSLDPRSGEVLGRRDVCKLPNGIAYDSSNDRLYVACGDGGVWTFAPNVPLPERTLRLGKDLRDIVVDGENLLVSRFRSTEVVVVDRSGTVVETLGPSAFHDGGVRDDALFTPSIAWRMTKMPGGGAVMVHQRGTRQTIPRPPYLHDACAPTLAARFTLSCAGGDRHGTTSRLTPTEIDDLVAYLESL